MSSVIHRETIPARAPWSRVIKAGQCLRIIDTHGEQAVDFLCYNADDPAERYHAPNTMKAAGTILLIAGHTLYSDKARALFTIEEDTFGGHDTCGFLYGPQISSLRVEQGLCYLIRIAGFSGH